MELGARRSYWSPFLPRPVRAVIALVLFCAPAAQPLLTDQLTCGYDNVLHLWRAIEVDALLDRGIVYARWQPHMALGYGYPLSLFQSPVAPLLAAGFHRLGLPWPSAVNGVFVAGILLSALAVWLLVREWWGEAAGVLSGVILVTLPFHSYVAYHRASMSEALAWAFPPLILWGLIRWQQRAQRVGLATAAGGLAALLLTHDASAYLFLPLPVAAVLALALANRSAGMLRRGVAALVLGAGLAAFFWVPSVAERGLVQFDRVLDYPYEVSFVAADYMLEAPRAVDPTLLNPWLPKGIGLLPVLGALLAPLAWRRADRDQRFWLAALAAATVGCVLLSMPIGAPVWRWLPALQYLHFPWRFLTPAAVGVAVLGGVGVASLGRRLTGAVPALAAVFVVGSLGWLYAPRCELAQPASLSGMLAYERATGELGGTTFSELLPLAVQEVPSGEWLPEVISDGVEPERLRPGELPKGARILNAEYRPLGATIELDSPVDFVAWYHAFDYPGWRVAVNGRPARIVPTEPEGLISFDVPAGRSTIEVRFGETPLRWAADAVSIVSLLALGWLLTWRVEPRGASGASAPRMAIGMASALLAVAALVAVMKVVVIDRVETPLRRSGLVDGRLKGADVESNLVFGGELALLGYDRLPTQVGSGERFEVRTYWRAVEPGGSDHGFTVHVVDPWGARWNDTGLQPPRWHRVPPPTGEWPLDKYAIVAFSVPLVPGTPPGDYRVELVAFERDTLLPLPARDSTGSAVGPAADLGKIEVGAPRRATDSEAMDIAAGVETAFGPVTLLGAHGDRAEAAPGDPFLLTTVWEAAEQLTEDLQLSLRLAGPNGSTVRSYELPLTRVDHPTSGWKRGEIWTGLHMLRLPAHLATGAHTWSLRVCRQAPAGCTALEPVVELDPLLVGAPDRRWAQPAAEIALDVQLGDVVTLVGATVEPEAEPLAPGDGITVTLVWRTDDEMAESYSVYLHLLGPDGRLIAQADGEPAAWTRPTTGWAEGEYVVDRRMLTVPVAATPGPHALRAGMYTRAGGRLTTADGKDGAEITALMVDGG